MSNYKRGCCSSVGEALEVECWLLVNLGGMGSDTKGLEQRQCSGELNVKKLPAVKWQPNEAK